MHILMGKLKFVQFVRLDFSQVGCALRTLRFKKCRGVQFGKIERGHVGALVICVVQNLWVLVNY